MQNGANNDKTTWDPMEIFFGSSNHKYAVVVLNQPILLAKSLVLPIWRRAKVKICVDGGTNRWMEYLDKIRDEVYRGNCSEYTPTFVTGDFDSILPDIIGKLKNISVPTINTPDQNHTDFSKALIQLNVECKQKDIHLDAVYVFVETAGRFDHIIGNINTLYQCKKFVDNNVKVINVASLKWNLDNSTLAFGGMISTSNTYDGSPEVTVTTDTEIIWTMGIESLVQTENDLN
ncbi:hypothetical protein PV328_006156 [Microctonus aethiopoides]|uniref:Thiamine diphosphokinase n=1 Tax=Microctonus aethiopoides TaxID=144406 RepID=A0AA39FNI2_9HYME|nr:hypothetical protein PV328_006156 [Microctonus aethiopoides]